MEPQRYCVKWKKHLQHFRNTLATFIDGQVFCDVTLASESQVFNAHQVVLSACSPYFENILSNVPGNKHPVIFLRDVGSVEIKILLDYMYKGEAIVPNHLLPGFLKTCELLKIQGLCDQTDSIPQNADTSINNEDNIEPRKRRKTGNTNSSRESLTHFNNGSAVVHLENSSANCLNKDIRPQTKNVRNTNNSESNLNSLHERNILSKDSGHIQLENHKKTPRNLNNLEIPENTHIQLDVPQSSHLNKESECVQSERGNLKSTNQPRWLQKTPRSLVSQPRSTYVRDSEEEPVPVIPSQESLNLTDSDVTNIDLYENRLANSNNTLLNNILDSPPRSEESFFIGTNNLDNGSNQSSESVILDDIEPNVITISDDELDVDDRQLENHTKPDGPYISHLSEGMIVHADLDTQNISTEDFPFFSSPLNLPEDQDSHSDGSEVIIRRKNKHRKKNTGLSEGTERVLKAGNSARISNSSDKESVVEKSSTDETNVSNFANINSRTHLKVVIDKNLSINALNRAAPSTSKCETVVGTRSEEEANESSTSDSDSASDPAHLPKKNKMHSDQLKQQLMTGLCLVEKKRLDEQTKSKSSTDLRWLRPRKLNQADTYVSGPYESLARVPRHMKDLYCSVCKRCVRRDVFKRHLNEHTPKSAISLRSRKKKAR